MVRLLLINGLGHVKAVINIVSANDLTGRILRGLLPSI